MKAVGIILAGGKNEKMEELAKKRAIAAMPVAGSFRCIDFALSNMSNSNVKKVAVLTQYNARSLNEHLNSSKWWDFGRKQGGLYLFTPVITADNSSWYRGTADALYQNLTFLRKCHEPYVILAGGHSVYKLDYNKVLDYHIEKQADITVVCKEVPEGEDISRFGIITRDETNRIVAFEEKPAQPQTRTISLGIYIFRRRYLMEKLERCQEEGRYDIVGDILIPNLESKNIYAYPMEGYWNNISTVESYFQTNKDFLKPEIRKFFFSEPRICSKVSDLPAVKYNPGSQVSNSLVSSGSIINGVVEDSLLFQKVFVGKGSVIRNSIILNDVHIGENVYIENCIVDSRETLPSNSVYKGEGEIRIVREKNPRYDIL